VSIQIILVNLFNAVCNAVTSNIIIYQQSAFVTKRTNKTFIPEKVLFGQTIHLNPERSHPQRPGRNRALYNGSVPTLCIGGDMSGNATAGDENQVRVKNPGS
jgi:hypothetical protein